MNVLVEQAVPEDIPSILALIRELAVYERAEGEVIVTADTLLQDGFGENKVFTCFVSRDKEIISGIALVYTKYSTWKGKCIFLEDIIVNERYRRHGIGSALFQRVIRFAKEKNAGRLEWQVLDWNEPAIEFYRKFEAEFDATWINCRFTGEQLMNMEIVME